MGNVDSAPTSATIGTFHVLGQESTLGKDAQGLASTTCIGGNFLGKPMSRFPLLLKWRSTMYRRKETGVIVSDQSNTSHSR